MKRLISILMILVLAVSLIACGGKDEPAENPSGQTEGSGITKKDNNTVQDKTPTAAPTEVPEVTDAPEPTEDPEPVVTVPDELTIEIVSNEIEREDFTEANLKVSYDTFKVLNNGYDELKAYFDDFNTAVAENIEGYAEMFLEDALEFGSEYGCYIYYNGFLSRVDEDVVSFGYADDTYLGGAHPSYYVSAFNIDTKTGREIDIMEFFPDGMYSDGYANLNKAVMYELKNYPDAEAFYYDYEDTVNSLMYDEEEGPGLNWFYGTDSLDIIFNPYQIAPYVAGMVEIEIPFKDGEFTYPVKSDAELLAELSGEWNILYSEVEGWGELVGFDEYGEILDGADVIVFNEDGTFSFIQGNTYIIENAALTFSDWTSYYYSTPDMCYFYVDADDGINSYYGAYDGENVYFTNEIFEEYEVDGSTDAYHVANYMVFVPGYITYHEAFANVVQTTDYEVVLSLKDFETLVAWDDEDYLALFGVKPEDFETDWMRYVYPEPAHIVSFDTWYPPIMMNFDYETMCSNYVSTEDFVDNLMGKSDWNDYYGTCVRYVNGQYGPIIISETYFE